MSPRRVTLDAADIALLRALQTDGRATNLELAAKAHLSESTCLRRVKQMEQTGVIERYVAVVNAGATGRPLTVFVTISLASQAQELLGAFEKAVAQVSSVMECHLMTGTSDYILRLALGDMQELELLHNQTLTRLPGVVRVVSSLALRTVVRRHALPL